mgnify:CR=1 FL=1
MAGFLAKGDLRTIDPDVADLIDIESERQYRKLIMIPSESTAPVAVREALGSVFQNLYAEGYPDEDTRLMSESEILNYTERLTYYRRYSDPRYYKGVEYVDVIESLARRRAAEVFANGKFTADKLFVNVQPLSGAPANNAVYTGLLTPGDTVLGLNLLHGGHLTHGSSVNRSGKLFHAVHYTVDPATEQLNYDQIEAWALESKPKMIIAGYSSYPMVPDWAKFRTIADKVGAILLADISHIAGLIAGKAIPSPVGHAHVISFTTHKTLLGPRSAVLITTDSAIAKKLDRAVFPGEQGGPHIHAVAALAVTLKLAKTEIYAKLQKQIIKNSIKLTETLKSRGIRIPFGGTNTHMANLDCKSIIGPDGTPLSGDLAARILDIAGFVTNRNTIPGDKTAMFSTGVRFGTPWMTQRGLDENDMVTVGNLMADVLHAIQPYTLETQQGKAVRAKVDFAVLEKVKMAVRDLAEKADTDLNIKKFHGYPHFFYLDDKLKAKEGKVSFELSGQGVRTFANYVFASPVEELKAGKSHNTSFWTPSGKIEGVLTLIDPYKFQLTVSSRRAALAATWLRELAEGYVYFDKDLLRRLPGPIYVVESDLPAKNVKETAVPAVEKPYTVGFPAKRGKALPKFTWKDDENAPVKRTALYETHKKLGAKMIPFAGWDMPVWYSSVMEEHLATREAAGLFDVSHMGVYQVEGENACAFLDSVCANDIENVVVGESAYTHLLTPDGDVIDDLIVYRRDVEKYLVVVNASNDDKDWAWLNAVKDGIVRIDNQNPSVKAYGRNVVLRNLRDTKAGKDMRVDIALQGPKSRDILFALGVDAEAKQKITSLKRAYLCEATVGGYDLIISRTGYTGEKMAFELFVHPKQSVKLWNDLMKAGEPFGLKPCGLGARDSLRTEAGLPLYGHEMGGDMNLGVNDAGFGGFVKTYKPWFVGRQAYLKAAAEQTGILVRFRFTEKAVRMAHHGDPIVDKKGKTIGKVTSCAVDSEGFLTGLAFVDMKAADEGNQIYIFQGTPKTIGKMPSALNLGDKFTLPTLAVIISRFKK